MIINKMDSKQEDIAELTALLNGKLTSYPRFSMERELKARRTGDSGEGILAARALAGFHTPKRVNFRARFGLPVQKQGKGTGVLQ